MKVPDPGAQASEAFEVGSLNSVALCNAVGGTDRTDTFVFTLDENSEVSITLTDVATSVTLRFGADTNDNGILEPNEIVLSEDASSGTSNSWRLPKNLELFVELSSSSALPINYVLNLTAVPGSESPPTDPGSLPSEAIAIESSLNEYVGAFDKEDWASFQVEAPAVVSLTMSDLQGGSVAVRTIQDINTNGIFDTGEEVGVLWGDFLKGTSVSRTLDPGTYFVRMTAAGTGVLYSLNLSSHAP